MKLTNIAGFSKIDEYVKYKTNKLREGTPCFDNLFELMFSEKENTLWETNNGYRIIKTTYGQTYQSILKKATTLQTMLGTAGEDNMVGIYMQNSLEWIESFWAILKCGFCPLLLNTRMETALIDELLTKHKVVAVISDGQTFSTKTILSNTLVEAETPIAACECGKEILVMSSGTTNSVKICSYNASAIYSQIQNAEQIVRQSDLIKKHYNGELKLLTFLPFYHIFGLTALYMWFAFYSRTFVYLKDMSSHTILNTIRMHNVTHIFAVPLFWNKVYTEAVKKIKERGDETYQKFLKGLKISNALSGVPFLAKFFRKKFLKEIRDNLFGESICFMITGGGVISSDVLGFFNGIGYHLSNGYGMSEIGITSVELSDNNHILNSCSIGTPMNSVEYRIDENNELLIRGSSLCQFYYDGEEKIEIGNSWFRSKDLAEERNGRYYLLGRSDDLVVSSSGENLNPNLFEEKLICEHIKQVCLIETKQNDLVAPVLLVEVNRYLSSSTLQTVLANVKSKLQLLGLISEIKSIVFVGECLIKDNEFKLNRKRLAKDYVAGKLLVLDPESNKEQTILNDFEQKVADCFYKALGKEIGRDDDFFVDAGGTSMDYFTMISYIQTEFDVIIPLASEKKMTTISSFCSYLKDTM